MGEIRNTSIHKQVLEYMTKHPGLEMHYETVARELNVPDGAVNSALNRMTHNENISVVRAAKGIYKYIPGLKKSKEQKERENTIIGEIYECIGMTGNGTVIVRGAKDNTMYVLQEINI